MTTKKITIDILNLYDHQFVKTYFTHIPQPPIITTEKRMTIFTEDEAPLEVTFRGEYKDKKKMWPDSELVICTDQIQFQVRYRKAQKYTTRGV